MKHSKLYLFKSLLLLFFFIKCEMSDRLEDNQADRPYEGSVGNQWFRAIDSAEWTGRSLHTSVAFQNKMWMIGGLGFESKDSEPTDGGTYQTDLWYSSDGIKWTQAIDTAEWKIRALHSSLVFDNKMWILGGMGLVKKSIGTPPNDRIVQTGGHTNEVWYSSDGIEWKLATANAAWSARVSHTSVVYDNKMWIIGGTNEKGRVNDVWSSTDGVEWTQATASAPWLPRRTHTSVVYDDKIWVIGGSTGRDEINDVWYSRDGIVWTQATASAPWSNKYWHTSIVMDNKMWIMGGLGGEGPRDYYKTDIWFSTDGTDWVEAADAAPWTLKFGYSSVVFQNKMWVTGGAKAFFTYF